MAVGLRAAGIVVGALSLLVTAACSLPRTGPAVAPVVETPAPSTAATAPRSPDFIEPPVDLVGRRLEAHRLAAATALVETSIPDRTEQCDPSGPFASAAEIQDGVLLSDRSARILEDRGFVTAWMQCSQSAKGLVTTTSAMELSDPVSAATAVTEMAAAELASARAQGLDAQLSTGPGGAKVLTVSTGGLETDVMMAAVGRSVAYVQDQEPPGNGAEAAGRLLADQVRLLAGFAPTAQADVTNLPLDPAGLARFAAEPPGVRDARSGPYDPEAYLRTAIDPVRQRALLTANGFTSMYVKESQDGPLHYAVAVYDFRSSGPSDAVNAGSADLETQVSGEFGGGTAIRVPAVPAAPCFAVDIGAPDTPSAWQRCYVGFGSHLASVDIGGLTAPDDVAAMDRLLSAERDLIGS